jgi:vacuolar-type H+-ATPase subunit C/Vma6
MSTPEIGLIARARGLGSRLLSRAAIESLAEVHDLATFAHGLERLGGTRDPIGQPLDVFAVEVAIARAAHRNVNILRRWEEAPPGVLDVFVANQDRRSLRALLRGAAQGASSEARRAGLLPTPLLPRLALVQLARQPSPAHVVGQLVMLAYPDAVRLLPLVRSTRPDLFAIDRVLLEGFAQRATRAATHGDRLLREFVAELIDVGNAQNALAIAGEFRDAGTVDNFVDGGRWLSRSAFQNAVTSSSPQLALARLIEALRRSPIASSLPVVAPDTGLLDRMFLSNTLDRLTRQARIDPLSSAPVLKMLLRIDAQSRDLRTLAWGVTLGTPVSLRKQQLVTPS